MNDIEICYRHAHTTHGEELVHALDGEFVPAHALIWPSPSRDSSVLRSREPMIAKVGGVVGGRAFLEAELYPFAELLNLYVAPAHRGKGVGSGIVSDSIRRVSELGYLAIHIQTDVDNRTAQRLYARHGFLPAQQGQMLRMIRFISHPLLSNFLSMHPLVRFDSRPVDSGDGLWILEWRSLIDTDSLTLMLSGGSCQADSQGYAPGVQAVELRTADAAFRVSIDGANSAVAGEEVPLSLHVDNHMDKDLNGVARLLLNEGFRPSPEGHGALPFHVAPGSTGSIDLPVLMQDTFETDFWKYSSYQSVSAGIELFLDHAGLWLTKQLKMKGA